MIWERLEISLRKFFECGILSFLRSWRLPFRPDLGYSKRNNSPYEGDSGMAGSFGAYRFAQFTLCIQDRQLLRGDQPVPVTPKVFDVLSYLVANGGRLVEKSELMANIWPDTFVGDVTLARTISDLRKVLGDGVDGERLIETVPKYGYRFVAPVMGTSTSAHVALLEGESRRRSGSRRLGLPPGRFPLSLG
jgi:DNA-binding winged helix-turn-helix (wHTH) protein